MGLRVLLVEPDAESLLFLDDVLTGIEEGSYWTSWVHIETLHAMSLAEALALLSDEAVDAVMLSLNLSDGQGVEGFRQIQELAPQVPVILMAQASDRSLAAQLIREGAQDFLLKDEIDCSPVAHALHNALERHRLLAATRASNWNDQLTGLLHLEGFLSMAERDYKLAAQLGARMMVVAAEPQSITAYGRQWRDLVLIQTAEALRHVCGETALAGRTSDNRFAALFLELPGENLDHIWEHVRHIAYASKIAVGSAICQPGQLTSLENLLEEAEAGLSTRIPVQKAVAARG
jgi:PleD family two-component response regulator